MMDLELETALFADINLRLPNPYGDRFNSVKDEECESDRKRKERIENSWSQEEVDAINMLHRFESKF